jgi:hypothetical protein
MFYNIGPGHHLEEADEGASPADASRAVDQEKML